MIEDKWYLRYKIAHRGLHNDEFPENSLGAFRNAVQYGFAVELDVRMTRDKKIVVFHDDDLNRVCGVSGAIEDRSYSELLELNILGTNEKIPLLSEVFDAIDGEVPILIELKPSKDRKEFLECVYDALKSYNGRYALQSFDPRLLVYFREKLPEVPRGMLSSCFKTTYAPFPQRIFIKHLFMFGRVNPDFISFDASDLPNKRVSSKKIPVLAWTVRSEAREKEVRKYANSIIFERYVPKKPRNF